MRRDRVIRTVTGQKEYLQIAHMIFCENCRWLSKNTFNGMRINRLTPMVKPRSADQTQTLHQLLL
jgi:hypothetical protein